MEIFLKLCPGLQNALTNNHEFTVPPGSALFLGFHFAHGEGVEKQQRETEGQEQDNVAFPHWKRQPSSSKTNGMLDYHFVSEI